MPAPAKSEPASIGGRPSDAKKNEEKKQDLNLASKKTRVKEQESKKT